MKAVILAGGLGTRISEETHLIPKPLIEIGGRPILWHIMKTYSYYGVNDFIICLGYKGYLIKEYFANYHLYMKDLTINLMDNKQIIHNNNSEPWNVTLVDTGYSTMTGGRIKRIKEYVKNEKAFFMTYGDGVSNVNLNLLKKFHFNQGSLATLTAVIPKERFGVLDINFETLQINSFKEKKQKKDSYINGGYFVLSPKVLDYIDDDSVSFEKEPIEKLSEENELSAYLHDNFWQCMDTLRDKKYLEDLWNNKKAPWKIWN
jgi:glucose-1-phosphate cytidylyltransferase